MSRGKFLRGSTVLREKMKSPASPCFRRAASRAAQGMSGRKTVRSMAGIDDGDPIRGDS